MSAAIVLIVLFILAICVWGISYAAPIVGILMLLLVSGISIGYLVECKRLKKEIDKTPPTKDFEDAFEVVEMLLPYPDNGWCDTIYGLEASFLIYFYENPDVISAVSNEFRNIYEGNDNRLGDIFTSDTLNKILAIQEKYFNIRCDKEINFYGASALCYEGDDVSFKRERMVKELNDYKKTRGEEIKQLWRALLLILVMAIPVVLYIQYLIKSSGG